MAKKKLTPRQWTEIRRPKYHPFKEAGETLEGTFLRIDTALHPEYGHYQRVVLQHGKRRVYCTGSMLLDLVACAGLREGDEMKIEYDGTITTNNGYEMKQFKLFVRPR